LVGDVEPALAWIEQAAVRGFTAYPFIAGLDPLWPESGRRRGSLR
jgi:hypothetical protein